MRISLQSDRVRERFSFILRTVAFSRSHVVPARLDIPGKSTLTEPIKPRCMNG